MDVFYKTLAKRNKTKKTGIYFKQIEKTVIDDKGKVKTSILKDDRVYCIQYKDIDNKWKFKTIGKYSDGIREAYCNKKRIEIMNQTMLGEQPDIIRKRSDIEKSKVTVNEVFDLFRKDRLAKGNVFKSTFRNFNSHILKRFGEKDIHKITTEDIIKFKEYLQEEKQFSTATVIIQITCMITLFNFAIEEGIYDKLNPAKHKKLKLKNVDNSRTRYLSSNEINLLLEAIKDDEILTIFVKLALVTGGRLEAILNIQKKDINLDNNTIALKDLKSKESYTGFLNADVKNLLLDICQDLNPNDYIVGRGTKKVST